MSMIDKERIAAVATLKALGYTFSPSRGWALPTGVTPHYASECDAMHAVLMHRADALAGWSEGSPGATELERIVNAIQAHEGKRWPEGKDPGRRVSADGAQLPRSTNSPSHAL